LAGRRQLTWPVLVRSKHTKFLRNYYVWKTHNPATG
jgi:hypothetical protein